MNTKTKEVRTILIYDTQIYHSSEEIIRLAKEIQNKLSNPEVFNKERYTDIFDRFYEEQIEVDRKAVEYIDGGLEEDYIRQTGKRISGNNLLYLDYLLASLKRKTIELYKAYMAEKKLENAIKKFGYDPSGRIRQYMDGYIRENPHIYVEDFNNVVVDIENEPINHRVKLNFNTDFNYDRITRNITQFYREYIDAYAVLLNKLKSKMNIHGFIPYEVNEIYSESVRRW